MKAEDDVRPKLAAIRGPPRWPFAAQISQLNDFIGR